MIIMNSVIETRKFEVPNVRTYMYITPGFL